MRTIQKSDYVYYEGLHFDKETPVRLQEVIAKAYHDKRTVRIFYGDDVTGVASTEEYHVHGYIGRSCGEIHVPLLLHKMHSPAGNAIDDKHIVGVKVRGVWVYKHPNLDLGKWRVGKDLTTESAYTWVVAHNDKTQARFPTEMKANRYIAFMTGERMGK